MAGKNGKSGRSNFGDIVFAKFEMTDEIEEAYETWLAKQSPDPMEALTHLLGCEYKVSLNHNEEEEFYSCSLTGSAEAKHNAGVCMMTYAESAEDAILLAIFKAEVFYEGGDWPTSAQRRKRR